MKDIALNICSAVLRHDPDWVAAIAAWVAILVSSFGLILIWFQLRASRASVAAAAQSAEAASAAAQTALMSERPWIAHRIDNNLTVELRGGELEIEVKWGWRNVGKTPAIRVIGIVHFMEEGSDLYGACKIAMKLSAPAPTLFPNEEMLKTDKLKLGPRAEMPEVGWRIMVAIVYGIPGDPERRVTAAEYHLRLGEPSGKANTMYPDLARVWKADLKPAVTTFVVHT